MRIIDVDAHFHEPLDWIHATDAKLGDALGPPARFMDVVDSVFGVRNPAIKALPEAQQVNALESILPGFMTHLEMTEQRQPAAQSSAQDDPTCAPEARLQVCDEEGIDVQFLNPSFLVEPLVQAGRLRRFDLLRPIRQCWNTWASNQVAGYTDRLIPVTQIDLQDLDWSIAEITRMRALGSRAFALPEAPTGHSRSPEGIAKSVTHPDFDRLWSAAVDLEMAVFAHVGFGRERINSGWLNNGASDVSTYSFLNSVIAPQLAPQLLLGAMAFDGVFERHPKLTVVVEEVGVSWLPHFLAVLDHGVGRTQSSDLEDGEYRPDFAGSAYKLPLAPSEYLRRQVRVTPLVASQPLRPALDAAPEMLCFSSDYPHVEGTAKAVELCERQLHGVSDSIRSDFYGGVGEMIGI